MHTSAAPNTGRHRDSLKLVMQLPTVGEAFSGGEVAGGTPADGIVVPPPQPAPLLPTISTTAAVTSTHHHTSTSPLKSSRASMRKLQLADGVGTPTSGGTPATVTVESGQARSPTSRPSTSTGELSLPGNRVHSFVASLPLIDGMAALSEGLGGHPEAAMKLSSGASQLPIRTPVTSVTVRRSCDRAGLYSLAFAPIALPLPPLPAFAPTAVFAPIIPITPLPSPPP